MGEVEVVEIVELGYHHAACLCDLVGGDIQVFQFLQLQQFLNAIISDIIVRQGKLVQLWQFPNEFQCLACDLIAPDVQAPQLLQLHYAADSIVRYLVVVDEEFPQILETVADGEEPEVADVVFPQDKRFQPMEGFNGLDVLVLDFAVGQVYFFCVGVDDEIFDGGRFGSRVAVDALHH